MEVSIWENAFTVLNVNGDVIDAVPPVNDKLQLVNTPEQSRLVPFIVVLDALKEPIEPSVTTDMVDPIVDCTLFVFIGYTTNV